MNEAQDSGMIRRKLQAYWYRFGRWLCKVFCVLFFRLRAYGQDNIPKQGSFILVSNHQSYLDPVFCGVGVHRDICYMARDTLFRSPILGKAIASVNAIPVKRGSADLTAIRKVIEKLNLGMGVCLFPEATRSPDGRVAAFKGGFTVLCKRTDAMIVPTVIDGAYECWPRHKKFWSRGMVVVCYGAPISSAQAKAMDDRALADLLTRRIRTMQHKWRKKLGKEPFDYSSEGEFDNNTRSEGR